MRVYAGRFQTIVFLLALYCAFIFRESWIQYIRCLSSKSKNSLHQASTHHDGANNSAVPIDVSSLRQSKDKKKRGRIRNADMDETDSFTDQLEYAGVPSGGAQASRTNSTARIPSPPTTKKADNVHSSDPTKVENLVEEKQTGELPPLRICRDSIITVADNALMIPFQCQGPNYNAFSLKLSKFIHDTTRHSTTWGRREVPFASNSSILFLGNQHLGQTASSLLCQYKEEIQTLKLQTNIEKGFTVEFNNGAVVEALINSHAVYSKNWKDLIELQLHKSLDSFGALVLGNFNHLNDNLTTLLEKEANQDIGNDHFEYTEPPLLQDIANMYFGNIVAVSSFSSRKPARQESKKMRMDIVRLVQQGRSNIRFINGRKFLKDVGQDGGRHRCSGANGGYPDLMSWEVIEKLNDLMEHEEGLSSDETIKMQTLNGNATAADDSTVVVSEDNIIVEDENDALLPLHICKVPQIRTDPGDPLILNYQCQGPNYEVFSQRLTGYMTNSSIHSSTWGRRPFPLPANKSILILGNSHTRQTAIGTLCQYQDQLKVLKPRKNRNPRKNGDEGFIAEFKNGAMMESLINNYALYGHNWKDLIELEIGKPLASFDALVLGKFNGLKDSQNTKFMKKMQELSKTKNDVDFLNVRPPGLNQVAAVYTGNIVAVSMFSDKVEVEKEARIMARDEALLHKNNRTNVRYIYGRKFVDILGLEGVSMDARHVDDSHDIGIGHRCTGAHGGHPDLMSWEVLENLNELLSFDGRRVKSGA